MSVQTVDKWVKHKVDGSNHVRYYRSTTIDRMYKNYWLLCEQKSWRVIVNIPKMTGFEIKWDDAWGVAYYGGYEGSLSEKGALAFTFS